MSAPKPGRDPSAGPVTDANDAIVWQPATSAPGELYTVEGEIRSYGAFARGLANHDPRLAPYRRSMWRTGAVFAGLAIALAVVAVVVAELV